VSGPSPPRRTTPAAPQRRLPRPLLALARGLARVSRHPLTDRVISGRWSIALIAFALIGIVTLQLGLLKLNVGVGHSLERAQTLERENATLGIENAELASPERIRQLAVRLGMSPVSLTQLRFVRAAHGHAAAAGAAARLHAPAHPAGQTGATSTGGEASSGETSSGETSGSEASGGEASSGEGSSSSEASSGETASGVAPSSEAPSGETASAEASSPSGAEGQASETGAGG
jgi:cell division protein FtsL